MKRKHLSVLIAGAVLLAGSAEAATVTPAILTTKTNKVPACVTPQRLMAFLGERNKSLLPKFKGIAADYQRIGDQLHVRWDYAFYQMIVETNALKFSAPSGRRGDVDPRQNNFAGLGATGHRAPGESFPDVPTGVLAHLQHVRLYSGDPVDNPVAERTRLVTDLILPWAQSIKHPVTFTDLTGKWASGHRYAEAIAYTAKLFMDGYCKGNDTVTPTEDVTASNDADADGAPDAASDQTTAEAPAAAVQAPAKKVAGGKPGKKAPVLASLAADQATDAAAPADSADGDASPAADAAANDGGDGAAVEVTAPQKSAAAKVTAKKAVVAAAAPAASDTDGDGAPDVASSDGGDGAAVEAQAPAKTASVKAGTAKATAKLTVAAAPADDTASGSDADGDGAPDVATNDGGDGAAVEAKAPVKTATVKATAKQTVAAKTVKKAIVAAMDGTADQQAADASTAAMPAAGAGDTAEGNTQLASLSAPAAPKSLTNCKVFSASYGGGKSLLIQSADGDHVRLTALTVNEAKADAQAKAFINVYAKGGERIGEFGTQNEALTKAFQMCPEG